MNLIGKLKLWWKRYQEKYIEPPIIERYIELKKEDEKTYKHRVNQAINRVIFIQYIIPAIVILVFLSYSIYYYLHQFISNLGVF